MQCTETVSYTHLDVYKRQILSSSTKNTHNIQLLPYINISFAILKSIFCHVPEKSLSGPLNITILGLR